MFNCWICFCAISCSCLKRFCLGIDNLINSELKDSKLDNTTNSFMLAMSLILRPFDAYSGFASLHSQAVHPYNAAFNKSASSAYISHCESFNILD